MADYGLKISQPFYDATKSADSNLLFSSAWPTMPIAAEKTFTSSLYGGTDDFSGATDLVFTHNLGFIPFVAIWTKTYVSQHAARYISGYSLTSTTLSMTPSTSLVSVHMTCYNINLETSIEYPFIKTSGTTAPYDNDFGIKIVRDGRDITSTDMRDFILHSRCQSPQILTIKTEADAVTSSLGGGTRDIFYTPTVQTPLWAFGFAKNVFNKWDGVNYYNQSFPRLFVTANTDGTYTYQLNIGPTAANSKAALVILRDPMFSSNNIQVTY